MKVRDAMSTDIALVSPDETIQEAARAMATRDVGALPVGENDRLVGMVTDRDIAVRAVARGLARRKPRALQAIGVDETSFQKRHEYVTVVTDLRASEGCGSAIEQFDHAATLTAVRRVA